MRILATFAAAFFEALVRGNRESAVDGSALTHPLALFATRQR
jgi:hypothetical protein